MHSRPKRKIDKVNAILIAVILGIMVWLGYSAFRDIRFSQHIRKENQKLAEAKCDFDRLKAMNPEIVAWLTVYDTRIDFPVVQGSDNTKYLTTSAYGEPAAYGAIFLDYRNDPDMEDLYSLIYGHHMSDGNMFGNIDRFREADFFAGHKGGKVLTPNKAYAAEPVAYLEVPSADPLIYDPTAWDDVNYKEHLNKLKGYMIHVNKKERKSIEEARASDSVKLLALSTCTSHDKEKRSVLLLRLKESNA